jgi:hypothetical protein
MFMIMIFKIFKCSSIEDVLGLSCFLIIWNIKILSKILKLIKKDKILSNNDFLKLFM